MKIPLFDLVHCLSDAVDLINPKLMSHHKRVTFVACAIAKRLELNPEQCENLFISCLLHDIGAIAATLEEKQELEHFEIVNPHKHAILGFLLIRSYEPFSEVARTIKYHHAYWNHGKGQFFSGHDIPIESYIIHLADRVDVLVNRSENILDQTDRIRKKISLSSGPVFMPEIVDCFLEISEKESFWLNMTSTYLTDILKKQAQLPVIQAKISHIQEIAKLFSHIIDFRSGFTAAHSSGVASTAEQLAKLSGVSDEESFFIGLAGYLHDIGKLVVPNEILDKPAPLTALEFNVVKQHSYYTYHILNNISIFSDIARWASNHHEKLDGSGYPFRHGEQELDLGSRILAVADIFTALTEDRPYRLGMNPEQVKKILKEMGEDGTVDPAVVTTLLNHYESINQTRNESQQSGAALYRQFWEQAKVMMVACQPT